MSDDVIHAALLTAFSLDTNAPLEVLAPRFEDSTHRLYKLTLLPERAMVFKVLSHIDSPFWQAMFDLFKVNISRDLHIITHAADALLQQIDTPIATPHLMGHGVLPEQQQPFIYSQFVDGTVLRTFSHAQIQMLAAHLSKLHGMHFDYFGALTSPNSNPEDWGERLARALENLGCEDDEILDAAESITLRQFSPIMPDLRPDQFMQTDDGVTLLDLDAIVIGDARLELALIECMFDETQINIFAEHYAHEIALETVRAPYRHLLFYMNVLGEPDLDAWLARPALFN